MLCICVSTPQFDAFSETLKCLSLASQALEQYFKDLNEHYDNWMFELIFEKQNIEQLHGIISQDTADLTEVVQFITNIVKEKEGDLEDANKLLISSSSNLDRSKANLDKLRTMSKVQTAGVATLAAMAVV